MFNNIRFSNDTPPVLIKTIRDAHKNDATAPFFERAHAENIHDRPIYVAPGALTWRTNSNIGGDEVLVFYNRNWVYSREFAIANGKTGAPDVSFYHELLHHSRKVDALAKESAKTRLNNGGELNELLLQAFEKSPAPKQYVEAPVLANQPSKSTDQSKSKGNCNSFRYAP